MYALEVLQTCPTQCKNILLALGAIDPDTSNTITFNLDYFKSSIYQRITLQISMRVCGKNIHRIVLDKGASTCVVIPRF